MHAMKLSFRLIAAAFLTATTAVAFAAGKEAAAKKAPSEKQLIASAMSAAPAAVAKGATIVTMDDKGMHSLRKGSNGFTCMPDNPATPGPDPMCMDKNAMEWVDAWVAHKQPPSGKVGFMYMLEGGTDGSNTDPYATKPDASNHWIKTGPHIMIVGGDAGDQRGDGQTVQCTHDVLRVRFLMGAVAPGR